MYVYVNYVDLVNYKLSIPPEEIFVLPLTNPLGTTFYQGKSTDGFGNTLPIAEGYKQVAFDIPYSAWYEVYVLVNGVKRSLNQKFYFDITFGAESQVKNVLPGQTLKEVVATITDASPSKIYTVYIHPNTTIGAGYVHPSSYIRLQAVHRQVWDGLDFGDANFTNARFNDMQFGSANFSLANLNGVWFTQCSFSVPNFQVGNTDFLTDTLFYNCDFSGGNFTGAKLLGTSFVKCNRTQPSVSLNFTNTTNWAYTNWLDSSILSNSILTGSPVTTLALFKAISNIKYSILTLYQDGVPILGFRNHGSIASASTLSIPSEGYAFITGTTNITSITALPAGSRLILNFEGILTVTDGSNLKLNGNYVTTADDTLQLVSNGTNWYETARSVN